MKKIEITLMLAALLAAPLAHAETAGKYYVGFDLGSASYSGVTVPAGTYPNPGLTTITGGYRVNDTWAAEVGYTKFGDSSLGNGLASATLSASSLHAAAVGSYPLTPQFDLIGKAGLASNDAKITLTVLGFSASSSEQSTDLFFGFGAQYHITPQVTLRAQYENFGRLATWTSSGTDWKAAAITFGGTYNF